MNTRPLENYVAAEAVLLALREQFANADPAWCCDAEKVSTLVQGLELTTLLMRDAGRRLQGCPPAALEAAVQSFLEQVERMAHRPTYPIVSVSHLAH